MKIPKPYFSGVLHYGDLEMEQIIVEYTYPLLSVLTDRQKNRYLCLCFEIRNAQKWLIVPISTEKLIGLLSSEVTLAAPFEVAKSAVLAIRNFDTNKESFYMIPAHEIPKEALPVSGAYLDAEDGEWTDYIHILRTANYSTPISVEFTMRKKRPVLEKYTCSTSSFSNWGYRSKRKASESRVTLCLST